MTQSGGLYRALATLLAVVALALTTGNRASAQVDTGSITGTVKDQTGAVIPGAKVTIRNQGTSLTLTTVTSSDGAYTFTPVRIGTYTVSTEFQGFQTAAHKDVTVNVQQQVVVDFTLVPGQVTQTVEVTTTVPLLQTQNASVGQVVNGKSVNDLPLNGRNFTFLAQLAAGVTSPQADTRGNAASGAFTANGNRAAQNNYLLDGIDNNADLVDFLNGTNYVVLPPPDAIGEFKIQTANYSAEFGRAGGAVLNATIKSGTNEIHGDVWEFLRNDKLDARDFFEANRSEFRLNQFGGSVGGPISIPHVYNGRDKTFFFADYQGTRIRQGTTFNTSVPTALERSSGFTNWSELLASGTQTDALGRSFSKGQVFDPATTRAVACGVADVVTNTTVPCGSGQALGTVLGYVRDPFAGNIIPAGRIDPNAAKLLNLFPVPTRSGIAANLVTSPVLRDKGNSFDARVDHSFGDRDSGFGRFSYVDEPKFIPGPFAGIADGGAFQDGSQTAASINGALSETHSFSPTLINEARAGFNRIGTSRLQANGNTLGIPAQFGILGIPQVALNGGLPAFTFNGLSTLGSNGFLVSDEINSTLQLTDNLTAIRGNHTFKGGAEFQHIKFSTLQPPFARGQFQFDGTYTNIPDGDGTNLGGPQFVITPEAATVAGGLNNVGGPDVVDSSNIANTDDGRNYYGFYFQDDWKATSKLTLNLGLRWDYFEQVHENFGAQANFIPGPPGAGAQYLIPTDSKNIPLSTSFTSTLAKDGIALVYSGNPGLGNSQKTNFAPRFGFAYQATPKLVARGGYGLFYGGFENRGFSPNIGENYPFQFSFGLSNGANGAANGAPNSHGPITYSNAVCPNTPATLETGFSCIPLTTTAVSATGLQLRGIQFNYITPYTQDFNLSLQYQLTPSTSLQVAYVASMTRHLESFPGSNRVSQILPAGTVTSRFVPFPDFSQGASYAATEGSSYYHGGQVTLERRFSAGLNMLVDYTYSRCRSDAGDLLNGGSQGGYRGPYLPGFGIQGDYQDCNFDLRNVFKASGGYQLPFGKGQRFASHAAGFANQLVSGWSTNFILTLQGGQPLNIGCASGPIAGIGCDSLLVPGQNPYAGPHNVNQWLNPAAFTQPCKLGASGPIVGTPAGCVPLTGNALVGGAPAQVRGPGFHRMDFSLFKEIPLTESKHFEFRAEFFNLTNHPNFNAPGFGGNGVVAIAGSTNFQNSHFGQIGSTRDNPNDPREIQFALKFYF